MEGEEQVFGKGAWGGVAPPRRTENGTSSGATDKSAQQEIEEMQKVQERATNATDKADEKRPSLQASTEGHR